MEKTQNYIENPLGTKPIKKLEDMIKMRGLEKNGIVNFFIFCLF